MVFGLGKKQQEPVHIVKPSHTPTDKVIEMRAQGLSNNQIIQILQRDGYDITGIFNAMNQADIKSGVDYSSLRPGYPAGEGFGQATAVPDSGGSFMPQQPMQQMQSAQPLQGMQPLQAPVFPEANVPSDEDLAQGPQFQEVPMQQMPQETEAMQQPEAPVQPMANYPQQMPSYGPSFETQRIEELAEAIIDEKWNEIVRSINKIIDWKERVEARVTKIEQQLEDMNKNFEALHKGVLGKITDYDKNLTNVGAEIKAMEKVFQKVLPTLTENVAELSRITSSVKKK